MQINWLKSAVLDLHRISEYIRRENPNAAEKTGALIEAALEGLATFPNMAPTGEILGTRELSIPSLPYFVVYRIRDDAVQVLRVMHNKQKWPSAS